MEVFLVPIGADRYELYCEVPDEPHEADDAGAPRGFLRGVKRRFHDMLAEAERDRRRDAAQPADPARTWFGRVKARMMRWVAESIAEQRLLWTMRRATTATFLYPADMTEADAVARLRTQLGRDFDKHQFWLVVDTLAFIASGLLMIVPGPNLVAYYFAFRVVGHYFSLRGARRGLGVVAWTEHPSAPLADLREAVHMEPVLREQRVHAIASALGLEQLPRFFKRTAMVT